MTTLSSTAVVGLMWLQMLESSSASTLTLCRSGAQGSGGPLLQPEFSSSFPTLSSKPSASARGGDGFQEVYNYTGETGTYRYMAPEVYRHEPYNAKVGGAAVSGDLSPDLLLASGGRGYTQLQNDI